MHQLDMYTRVSYSMDTSCCKSILSSNGNFISCRSVEAGNSILIIFTSFFFVKCTSFVLLGLVILFLPRKHLVVEIVDSYYNYCTVWNALLYPQRHTILKIRWCTNNYPSRTTYSSCFSLLRFIFRFRRHNFSFSNKEVVNIRHHNFCFFKERVATIPLQR